MLYTDFITGFEWPTEVHYGPPYGLPYEAYKRTGLGLPMRARLLPAFWHYNAQKNFVTI